VSPFRCATDGLASYLLKFKFLGKIDGDPEHLVFLVWCDDPLSLPNCSGLFFLEKYEELLFTYLGLPGEAGEVANWAKKILKKRCGT